MSIFAVKVLMRTAWKIFRSLKALGGERDDLGPVIPGSCSSFTDGCRIKVTRRCA